MNIVLLLPVLCISFKIWHLQLISWLDCRVLAMRSFCCCPSLHRRLCSACLRWNRHSVRSKITGPADKQDHGINQISPPRKRSTTNGQLSFKIAWVFFCPHLLWTSLIPSVYNFTISCDSTFHGVHFNKDWKTFKICY